MLGGAGVGGRGRLRRHNVHDIQGCPVGNSAGRPFWTTMEEAAEGGREGRKGKDKANEIFALFFSDLDQFHTTLRRQMSTPDYVRVFVSKAREAENDQKKKQSTARDKGKGRPSLNAVACLPPQLMIINKSQITLTVTFIIYTHLGKAEE